MELLFNIVDRYIRLSPAAKVALEDSLKRLELKSGDLLLRQSTISREIYFLESGLVRGFYDLDGNEITSWFAYEGLWFASLHSFIEEVPSLENIEALEDSKLYSLKRKNLYQLYQEFPEFNVLGRMIAEQYYIEVSKRALILQTQSAHTRYSTLIAKRPQLLQRVPLKYIASYLGISQETLSRVRKK